MGTQAITIGGDQEGAPEPGSGDEQVCRRRCWLHSRDTAPLLASSWGLRGPATLSLSFFLGPGDSSGGRERERERQTDRQTDRINKRELQPKSQSPKRELIYFSQECKLVQPLWKTV